MLIRIKQSRANGTHVELGKGADKRVYHFKPKNPQKPDEEHVCEVNNKDDIATLLAIKEGYEIHDSELKGTRVTPTTKTEPTGNAADADKGKAAGGSPAPDYTKMDKSELLKLVEKKTGKKPHPSTVTAKLIATLQAA